MSTEMVFCDGCQQDVPRRGNFCFKCGAKFEPRSNTEQLRLGGKEDELDEDEIIPVGGTQKVPMPNPPDVPMKRTTTETPLPSSRPAPPRTAIPPPPPQIHGQNRTSSPPQVMASSPAPDQPAASSLPVLPPLPPPPAKVAADEVLPEPILVPRWIFWIYAAIGVYGVAAMIYFSLTIN